jgi:hypothetical protein
MILQLLMLTLVVPETNQATLELNTQPNQRQHFLFSKLPDIAFTNAYAHFRIPFPIKPILTKIEETIEDFHTQIRNICSPSTPCKSEEFEFEEINRIILKSGLDQIQVLHKQAKNIIAKFPSVQRNKRFIDYIGAFSGIAALGISLYNTARINTLNKHIQEIGDKQNQLVDITHIHQQHLEKLEIQIKKTTGYWAKFFQHNPTLIQAHVTAIVTEITQKIQLLEDLLDHGIHNKLSHKALSTDVLLNITYHLKQFAENKKLANPVKQPLDLLHMDCSFLFSAAEYTLTTIIHVPLFDRVFRAYQFQPLPLTYPIADKFLIPDVGPQTILGTRNDQLFFLTSPEEMRNCQLMGGVSICKGRNVFLTNLDTSCLGAIFTQNEIKTKQNCEFKMDHIQEHAVKISRDTFLIITPSQFFTQSICKTSAQTGMDITNLMQLQIAKDCVVPLRKHLLIGPSDDYEEEEVLFHVQWDISLKDIIPKINVPKSINDTLSELDRLQQNLTNIGGWEQLKVPASTWTDPYYAGLLVALALIVIGFVINFIHLRIIRLRQRPIFAGEIQQDPNPKTINANPRRTQVYPDLNTDTSLENPGPTAPNCSHPIEDVTF